MKFSLILADFAFFLQMMRIISTEAANCEMFFHCSRGIIRVWLGTGRDYKSDYFFYDLFQRAELLTYEQVAGRHHYCSGKITKLSSG